MDILIIGNKDRAELLESQLPASHEITIADTPSEFNVGAELIIDLDFENNPENFQHYSDLKILVMVAAVKTGLAEAIAQSTANINCNLIGLNTIPYFLGLPKKEISLLKIEDKSLLEKLSKELNWEYQLVADRVGMLTPRVIFMIINEACYTLQEGTAGIEDIDLGMKLGTNYPFGPFEWADKIGIQDVYETLDALYNDTKEERYKICPLLKRKYQLKERFYN